MTHDVDQLLRDTLQGRAATVTEAQPRHVPTSARTHRAAWPAVAAALTVLGLAAGLVALHAGDEDTPAGGRPAAACLTTLPTGWQRAAHRLAPSSGPETNVRAVTANGVGIGEAGSTDPAYERIVRVAPDNSERTLWRVRTDHEVLDVDTDGTWVVLAVAPLTKTYEAQPAVDDLAVIDLRSGRVRHVLAQAPIPHGWIVTWRSTVIEDGVVFFVARPRSSAAGTGQVLAYTVATGRYRIAGRAIVDADPMNAPQLVRDIRGVGWRGGSVPNARAPQGLPAFYGGSGPTARYQPVHSDGRDVAWQDADEPFVLHWRDDNGDVRTVRLAAAMGPSAPAVNAVAGAFVFLAVPAQATQYVLDTAAPALARFDADANAALSLRGVLAPASESVGLLLGTTQLPELRCG